MVSFADLAVVGAYELASVGAREGGETFFSGGAFGSFEAYTSGAIIFGGN